MNKVENFLKLHNQCPSQVDIKQGFAQVSAEIDKGLGEPCSMPMIPTYMSKVDKRAQNSKKLLIDAGGTNFRSAIGYFDDSGQAVISDQTICRMPAASGRLSKEQFYGAIAQNVQQLLSVSGDVGFCFSYNVNMQPDIDGTVDALSKELDAPEVIGTKVGRCTLDAIAQLDGKARRVVVLNDTVATLLGGSIVSQNQYSGYIGFIYGTGTNVCYLEKTANIVKLPKSDSVENEMIINMECGGYDKFATGDFDKAVIAKTAQPHLQIFEKMTGGRYLGDIIQEALASFNAEGNFCGKVTLAPFSLKDVTAFLNGEQGTVSSFFDNAADTDLAKQIMQKAIERSAKMWAIFLSAVVARYEASVHPVAIVSEGTTFHKLAGFRENLQKYLDMILSPLNKKYQIVTGDNLNLLGTLKATSML